VVVLGHVPAGIVLVGGRTGGVLEPLGGAARVHDIGEAVGAGRIAVGVREVVYHAVGVGGYGDAAPQGGLEVAVEVVGDAVVAVVVGVHPRSAVVGEVVGGGQAVGAVVGEAAIHSLNHSDAQVVIRFLGISTTICLRFFYY
jgi:hypothetical protein